jgi:hypothetical protein
MSSGDQPPQIRVPSSGDEKRPSHGFVGQELIVRSGHRELAVDLHCLRFGLVPIAMEELIASASRRGSWSRQ